MKQDRPTPAQWRRLADDRFVLRNTAESVLHFLEHEYRWWRPIGWQRRREINRLKWALRETKP